MEVAHNGSEDAYSFGIFAISGRRSYIHSFASLGEHLYPGCSQYSQVHTRTFQRTILTGPWWSCFARAGGLTQASFARSRQGTHLGEHLSQTGENEVILSNNGDGGIPTL